MSLIATVVATMMLPTFNAAALTAHQTQPTYDFTSTTSVKEYILAHATATPRRALYIAYHESKYKKDARGDLYIICRNTKSPFYGEPVTARGVWAITRCWFPEITDEQADSVEWATAWALPKIADPETCKMLWTTCRAYFRGSHVIE